MFVRININIRIFQILFLYVNITSKKSFFAKSCIIRKIYKDIYSISKIFSFFLFSLFLSHKKFLPILIPYRYRYGNIALFQIFLKSSFKINVLSWNTTERKKKTINQIIKESITWIIELATDIPLGAVFK